MASTYTPITATTLTTNTSEIDFTGISSSYTDLVLVASAQKASGGNPSAVLRFNSDSGTNYSMRNILGNGSTVTSYSNSNANELNISYFTTAIDTNYSLWTIHIMNYANTSTYKTVLVNSGEATSGAQMTVGLWRSTAAITAVKFRMESASYALLSGSSFTLYGIKAA